MVTTFNILISKETFGVAITKKTKMIFSGRTNGENGFTYDSNYELTTTTFVHYSLPSRYD